MQLAAPLTHYLRARAERRTDGETLACALTGPQSSGMLTSMARGGRAGGDRDDQPAHSEGNACSARSRWTETSWAAIDSPDDHRQREPVDAAALREDLERRFRTATRTVELGGREVELLSPANADDLISEDDYVKDERLPYWADLWPSAQILAREVREMRLAGERVLELGCGLGLVAIGAALAGGEVTATDYYDDAMLFATLNVVEATGADDRARMVDWTAMPPDLGRFDVVLTSDVLYEPRYAGARGRRDHRHARAAAARRSSPTRAASPARDFLDRVPRARAGGQRRDAARVRGGRDPADDHAVPSADGQRREP